MTGETLITPLDRATDIRTIEWKNRTDGIVVEFHYAPDRPPPEQRVTVYETSGAKVGTFDNWSELVKAIKRGMAAE